MPEVMSIEVDEEFDPRPPKQPFSLRDDEGKWNWPMIAGIALAIILVIALIIVVAKPFEKEKPVVVSNWKPTDPTVDIEFLESYSATSPMTRSVQSSLDALSKFYFDGRLDNMGSTFDLSGPQYAIMVSQQAKIQAAPQAGGAAIVQLGPLGEVSRKDNIFKTRVVVTWTIPGTNDPTEYRWDIDMKAQENRFVLFAIVNTEPGAKPPINFCGAVNLVAELDSDETVEKEIAQMPSGRQFERTVESLEIRLKTWQFLADAVAGTDSEQDVTPIVNEYETLVSAGRKAKNISELANGQARRDLTVNRRAIESRASDECEGADISDR
jgi:hypothetical protein